jgi:preprotein translocase subunit SecG
MLLNILLVILVLVCAALTGVILLQRSEGGALGMGGGPSGMFTARGAGDLLTRATSILAGTFFVLALAITLLAGHNRANSSITQRLKIGPEDLGAVTHQQPSSPASSGPAAPPLPGSVPPLPAATAQPQAMPTQAPRPTLRTARAPAAPTPFAPIAGNQPVTLPKPDLGPTAPPADQTAPQSK